MDVITKYNKNEISPWLQDFYKTVDPNANPLPSVQLKDLYSSTVTILSPVYHFVDIIFHAAQADYKVHRDPMRVAFAFILLNKTSLLSNLYKMAKQQKISDFLKRDFSLEQN